MENKKGKLIVLEGADGSGKATQAELLAETLKNEGFLIESVSFPDYTGNLMGGLIRECLDGFHGDFSKMDPYVVSTLYAGDRFAVRGTLEKWLREGKIVIADRYVSSNQLHQGSKFETTEERRKFLKWLDELEYSFYKLPRPDRVLYLDVPFEISEKLLEDRARESGKSQDHAEMDKEHLKHARECGEFLLEKEASWRCIDCAPSGELLSREKVAFLVRDSLRDIAF